MGELYAWGEVIARGMDNDGTGDEDDKSAFGRAAGSRDPNMEIADAAKLPCEWFGDEKATSDCEELAAGLRALAEKDKGGITGMD